MPTAITLHLRTVRRWTPDTRQLHGLACTLFETTDSAHTAPAKPFTIHPPTPDPDSPGTTLLLRAFWLAADRPPPPSTTARLLRLGNIHCHVTRTTTHTRTYAQLATTHPTNHTTLVFHSPTYFSRDGEPDLTPNPDLILGSHRRAWNTENPPHTPFHIDDDSWKALRRALRTDTAEVQTSSRPSGYDRDRKGFTGTLGLYLSKKRSTEETRRHFAALTHFAPYAGTGAGTTHGFGATTTKATR